jgi:hypothetical protein
MHAPIGRNALLTKNAPGLLIARHRNATVNLNSVSVCQDSHYTSKPGHRKHLQDTHVTRQSALQTYETLRLQHAAVIQYKTIQNKTGR